MELIYENLGYNHACSVKDQYGFTVETGEGQTKELAKADLLQRLNEKLEANTRKWTLALRFVVDSND